MRRGQAGVTLIELITVLVVLSILAVIGTGFIVSTTNAYQQTQERARVTNTGRLALERMTRELRNAQPFSLALEGENCVRYLPVVAGGVYLDSVPDQSNGRAPAGEIEIIPVEIPGNVAYVSIGALQSSEFYQGGESIAEFQALAGSTLSVVSTQWARNSVSRRFYLLGELQGFCLIEGELRFYRNLAGLDENLVNSDAYELLARNIGRLDGVPPFELEAPTERRNATASIAFTLSDGRHSVDFEHEVHIRNVP